jgi:hypothetical protein
MLCRRPRFCEGGFAIARHSGERLEATGAMALATTRSDLSAVFDLGSSSRGRVHEAAPNTNLIAPRTLVPQCRGDTPAGISTPAIGMIGGADPATVEATTGRLPLLPGIGSFEKLVAERGRSVTVRRCASD